MVSFLRLENASVILFLTEQRHAKNQLLLYYRAILLS